MEYHSIANPVWTDSEHKLITVDIVFPSFKDTPVKFNASPDDPMDYGREIHAALIAGTYGPIANNES